MKHRARRTLLYYGLLFLRLFVLCLPRAVYLTLGKWAGWGAYTLLPHEREKTEHHLKLAFGKEKDDREVRRIARSVFGNLGQNLAEWISFPKYGRGVVGTLVQTHGIEKLKSVLQKGRGVIISTAHFGNWELITPAILNLVKESKGTVVARRLYYDKYDKLLVRMRLGTGVGVVYRDAPPRRMLEILRRNEMLGILPDQDADSVDGIFTNFFGRPAYTPTGPAALARAARTDIVPCFIIREGSRHRLEICDPIRVDSERKDKRAAIREATETWTRVLENYIRRYPDQWVWMHRRWKTQA